MQKKESEIVLWWESDENEGSPLRKTKLLIHQLQSMDLPIFKGLKVESLPAIIFVDESKKIQILNGVTDKERLKSFCR